MLGFVFFGWFEVSTIGIRVLGNTWASFGGVDLD